MLQKLLIIGFLLVILYTLFSSFYFLVKDKGKGKRTVNRLSWRVALSLFLFLMLVVAIKLGWIEPHGYQPSYYLNQPQQTG